MNWLISRKNPMTHPNTISALISIYILLVLKELSRYSPNYLLGRYSQRYLLSPNGSVSFIAILLADIVREAVRGFFEPSQ